MSTEFAHEPHVCTLFHEAIELIGRRWTGAILFTLSEQPRRFGEIKGAIPELSDRLLTERLKELEAHGVILREVGAGRPVTVSYRLSPKGCELTPILQSVGAWAARWHARPAEAADAIA